MLSSGEWGDSARSVFAYLDHISLAQWVPPNYWLTDPGVAGGAFGFLTEGGPGENPMIFESLAATVPASDLWPPSPNDCWGHCGNPEGFFGDLSRFNGPLAMRYGVNASNASLGVRAYLYAAHAQVRSFGSVCSHRSRLRESPRRATLRTRTHHWQAYEGHRAMFEGYSRNKAGAGGGANATGVIQWMYEGAKAAWRLVLVRVCTRLGLG